MGNTTHLLFPANRNDIHDFRRFHINNLNANISNIGYMRTTGCLKGEK